MLSPITDRNAKLVIGYIELDPVDIYNLDFRKPKYIDGHW